MRWIWQRPEWPRFRWEASRMAPLETRYQLAAERSRGARWHFDEADGAELQVEWLTDEAVETSAIEGETLDRDSVRSSIRSCFGLAAARPGATPAETGAADLMVALYREFARPLDFEMLFDWHRRLLRRRTDLSVVGAFRRGPEPMQVVSSAPPPFEVRYEAPPSDRVPAEMRRFVTRYERAAAERLPPLTWAGLAHLDFVFIHPFEDGNGRLARALAEKALARASGRPSLIALSRTISRRRRAYYDALERANRSLDLTDWLRFFGETVLAAQQWSERRLIRTLDRARMFRRLGDRLNDRQQEALRRLFRAEPEGFEGGLSAGDYRRLTGATPATATRDLAALVALGVLCRTGARRHTRYFLDLPPLPEEPGSGTAGDGEAVTPAAS